MQIARSLDRRKFLKSSTALAGAAATLPFGVGSATAAVDELALLDGLAQAELIRTRKISALELTRKTVERIEASEPFINALVAETFDAAIKRARVGNIGAGPFAGVPYLIKELQEYPGLPQTFGSRPFANNIGRYEHPYIRRTRQAGFNVFGTSASPEFGLLATTESLFNGPTRNPWNRGHSPGGSSGGAAAAVAAGMVPLAHASDGGGSIRIPASCCGVFGLKPSRSRNVATSRSQDSADISVSHCVSRSVRDSAMLLSLTEARGRAARFDPVGFVSEPDTKRLRIAASARNVFQDRPHKEVRNAVEDTADLCEDLGHEVDDAIIELDGEEFIDHFLVVWAAGPAQLVADYRKRYGKLPDDSVYESWTLGLAEHFASKPSDALENALSYFKSVARQVELFFDNYDVALSPTLFTPPPPLGEQGPVAPFGDLYDRVVKYVSYTPVHNVAGTPAMSVPLHWTKEGLPVGSQFAARQGNEAMLLKLAYELEEAKPWANKWPFICAHTMFSQV